MSNKQIEKFNQKYGENLSNLNADINVTFKKKRREFYDFYAQSLPLLERMRSTYHNLITLLTSELESGAPKIVSRIKDRNECVAKFERNYRTRAEKSQRDKYAISDYITDLVGLRVICLYEDDVDKVKNIIQNNFDVIEITDKTKQLEENYEKFGYKGLHLDINLNDMRGELPEFRGFDTHSVEVQVRSIVQDAWSEVDHRLKYKKSIPDRLKRKIVRIAALFELADQEFTQIREDTQLLEALRSDDDLSPNRKIDSFSFIAAMKDNFSNYNFENKPDSESAQKIDGFVEEILFYSGGITDGEFQSMMAQTLPKVDEYKKWKHENGGFNLNPFTTTRHILYLYDQKAFKDILFEGQRKAFDAWLNGK